MPSSPGAIADRAGATQGLIFYHFGTVANLLLAALDAVSAERLEHYGAAVHQVGSLGDLVEAATAIFREDLDAGYVTVLAEMIAGASATPGLGAEVAAAHRPLDRLRPAGHRPDPGESPLASVLPSRDIAYGVVALYLGLEMLSHLDGDRAPALALFAHAAPIAGLFSAMSAAPSTNEAEAP